MKDEKNMEKVCKIENFIGVYDNFITPQECDNAINLYEKQDKFKNTVNRLAFEKASILKKQDQQYFANTGNLEVWYDDLKIMLINFDIALKNYEETTGVKSAFGVDDFAYTTLKIQKTLPTEGYHVWHVEHNANEGMQRRALAFGIYLNEVEDGGETEFLHFSVRVKPKKGRIVIWPASFPYVHRGNPPLSGEKYLLTSWMLFK